MSGLGDMRAGVASQIDRVSAMIDRATLAPMLVRATVLVAALVGLAVAYPPGILRQPVALVLVPVAMLPALFPRGPWPSGVICTTVFGWLISTAFDGTIVTMWRLTTLAAAMYLVHVGAAFAAVLPYDAIVTRGLFLPWVIRAAVVVVLTAGVALFVLALPSLIGTRRLVVASIAGFVVMIAIALYLSFLGRRR